MNALRLPTEVRPPFELGWIRSMIDRVDDAFLVLLAGRRQLVRRALQAKRTTGLPVRDRERERQVHARAQYFAQRLGLSSTMTQKLTELLIEDACGIQGLPSPSITYTEGMAHALPSTITRSTSMQTLPVPVERLLGHLPPPGRVFQPLRWLLPSSLLQIAIRKATLRVLAEPLASGVFDDLQGRKLGIEVTDLKLKWVVEIRDRTIQVQVPGTAAESSVRGSVTDLLLLVSRLEDADTLFFQRRLQLVGDTELGLMVRNLLDQLPWETIPLALRVFLNRGARLARRARSAHRGESIS